VFHLAWWQWRDGGTDNRIVYKSSPDGVAWDLDHDTTIAAGPGDFLPSLVVDRLSGRLLVFFASPSRNASGSVDLGDLTFRLYVVIHDAAGWGPPRRLEGIGADTSHHSYPFAVQRDDGVFLMTWTRYRAASLDVLRVVQEPSTETMFSTSSDGIRWNAPAVLSEGAGSAIDVFPSLYADHARATWRVLWLTAPPGATSGTTVEMAAGGTYPADLVRRPEVAGYTGRVLATATPGIYWGAWVSDPEPRQKVRYRFFSR
jgi:hypothetical protein